MSTFANHCEEQVELIKEGLRLLLMEIKEERLASAPDSPAAKMCTRLQGRILVINTDVGALTAQLRAAVNTREMLRLEDVEHRHRHEPLEDGKTRAANDHLELS